MDLMSSAFAVVYYALAGILAQFSRLFAVFNMGSFLYPILIISVVYGFIIAPFVHRAHGEAIEGVYLRSKLGQEQIGDNITQRKMNNLKWRMTELYRVKRGDFS